MEYFGNSLELIHIPNGRITEKVGVKSYQYQISDHLGNIVVLFEDINDDGIISLEEETNGQDDEVIQRNHYYSFGMRVNAPHFNFTVAPRADYLYNGKELQEELGLNWLSFGFREYDPVIARFPSVDPIADQFAHVSGFNYAENSPIANIDLWGLQKVWSSSGEHLENIGDDTSIRIFDGSRKEFDKLSKADKISNSRAAFRTSSDNKNELKVLGEWAKENQNSKREYSMSLFTKFIEHEDGNGYFEVFIEGTRAEGPEWKGPGHDARVDPTKSVGLKGWRRYHTIHTHPKGNWREFSNEPPSRFSGGDIQFAMGNYNANLYLVPPSGNKMGEFSPVKYRQRVLDYYARRYGIDNAGPGTIYWAEPHLSSSKTDVNLSISPIVFK